MITEALIINLLDAAGYELRPQGPTGNWRATHRDTAQQIVGTDLASTARAALRSLRAQAQLAAEARAELADLRSQATLARAVGELEPSGSRS